MKVLKLAVAAILGATLYSCGGAGSVESNAQGFASLEKEIKGEFGDDAYFTELTVINIDGIGHTISTTLTKDPSSLEMGEWNYTQGAWTQSAEVTIEISEGSKAEDFMFQLGDKINLEKLGGLVEKSKESLTEEKSVENPKLTTAFIKYPDNGDASKANYVVTLEPENGGTSFTYYYELNGDFIEMNY